MAVYAKAVVAAFAAGLGSLLTAMETGGTSPKEWVTVAIAFLVALGAVYTVPNRPG